MVQRERSHNDYVQEVVEVSPGVYGESLDDEYTGPHFREWDEWSE